tara:strand:- start:2254 stop:2604 length:351 start_codon:yes stop_codon:yes gene_type:complete
MEIYKKVPVKQFMIADFEVEGFHHYPMAPEPVEFLQYDHRHLFQIRMAWTVDHANREKEIFIYTDKVKNWIQTTFGSPAQFNNRSCEMIAEILLEEFDCEWVEVLEDGKGGGRVEK